MLARILTVAVLGMAFLGWSADASAQTFGVDLHNVAQPASGGMAGVSLARPQDAPSALFGNPSTMSQYGGTTFTTGFSWLDPTVQASHDGALTGFLGGGAWSGTSQTQGFLVPNIAALQDLRSWGIAGTAGVGLTASSGLGTNFRNQPGSVGTAAEYHVYTINGGVGIDVTDKLSVGASATVALGIFEAGFASTSAMSHAYAPRGTFGFDYDLPACTTFAGYYQTRMPFRFNDVFLTAPGSYSDVNISQPDNFGIGLSNQALCGGNLLLAIDIIWKQWQSASFWRDYFQNQWVFAVGAQYTRGNWKYRTGYSFAENPINKSAAVNAGPIQQITTEYLQGTELPAISRHRVTAGLGYCGLMPGLSCDVFAGGMLPQSQDFGVHTEATAFAWYGGVGLTWAYFPVAETR